MVGVLGPYLRPDLEIQGIFRAVNGPFFGVSYGIIMSTSFRAFLWALAMGPAWILVGSFLWAPVFLVYCTVRGA